MAIHVADHPPEYYQFEGVIPKGQYGAGDVTVWDWGTWEPDPLTPDARAAVAAGELKFALHGEKLRGRFTIVRTRPVPGGQDQWLLLHKRDEHAVPGWDARDHPRSVLTGMTNDEVRASPPGIWASALPVDEAQIDLSRAVAAPMPEFVQPMLATLASDAFDAPDWLFEVKWDGFRVQALVDDGAVRLRTRNDKDARGYFPALMTGTEWIEARQAVVDGEVVALDAAGRPDFGLLQESLAGQRSAGLVYQAFDLLHVDGRSLLGVPLEHRKRLLRLLLRPSRQVRFADHVLADGTALLTAAREQGLEGIVAKRRDSTYQPGARARTWIKVKLRPEQELVVGGWTPAKANPGDLGALVVGVYDDGHLRFSGKVGSGFDARARRALMARLGPLTQDEPAFEPPPPPTFRGRWGGDLAGVTWVRPDLVIRAELGGWSRDGMVRQAAYKGLDVDRDPASVRREVGVEPPAAPRGSVPSEAGRAGQGGPSAHRDPASQADPDAQSEGVAPPEPGAQVDPATKRRTASSRQEPTRHLPGDVVEAVEPGLTVDPEELAALAALPAQGVWRIAGRELRLTNLDKPLFTPRPGTTEPPVTKRELIAYFAQVAPVMLPHLADRPLNLHRFPNGVNAPGFWQKDIPRSAPAWLTRWVEQLPAGEPAARSPNTHLVADGPAALAWLGNQAAFEVHAWTSTIQDPLQPTFALIDIDPGASTTWEETVTLAQLFRTALNHLGVRGYPKTTGSRGVQVWVPVVRGKYRYQDTSQWVERLSRAVGAIVPDLVSWEWTKRERGGRARLDFTQNAAIKTLVSPYAVRPRPGAPVSVPITWDELDDPDLASDRWTIRDVPDRIAVLGDVFAGAQSDEQDLPRI